MRSGILRRKLNGFLGFLSYYMFIWSWSVFYSINEKKKKFIIGPMNAETWCVSAMEWISTMGGFTIYLS